MNINFSKSDGLVPAIIQDASTKKVLMLGYMNKEAYEKRCEQNRENGKRGGRPKKRDNESERPFFDEKTERFSVRFQVFLMNFSLQRGQEMAILPLPLGTRTGWRHRGQL